MTARWLRHFGTSATISLTIGATILAPGCGDDGTPMDMGTSSTGVADASSSSSSTGDDTTSSSSEESSSSSSTGVEYPPAVGWGDCSTIPEEFACLPEEVCVAFGAGSVCMRPDCADSFDCPPELRTGSAPVVCGEVSAGQPGLECYYLCSGMQSCPDGMVCDGDACVWP